MTGMADGPTAIRRMLDLVAKTPGGLGSRAVARAIGVSDPTASRSLARLYWRGLVDRHMEGNAYCYTPRST